MSRREKVHEVSSPISLFPFIGILLCTMGALLVILVAVSRSASDTAKQEVVARTQAGARQHTDEVAKKLAVVTKYAATLSRVRGEGQQTLTAEQRQLRNLDDHIRRLREQFKSLQIAAVELEALEEEHYDDRRQAEKEVERLQQLVAESQKQIEQQRIEFGNAKSYALVPYEGPNGTYRRPIYIECRKGELIMQPEGTSITRADLQPPYGAGNPLAAAIRAARDHYVRLYPNEGQSRDTEPYPLLICRPDGLGMCERARRAIEAADFDFGVELAESDWELKYPTADAKLAEAEQLAVEQARVRQEVLAEAAPRAYRHPSLAASGEFEYDEDQTEGYARGPSGVYVVRAKSKQGSSGGSGFGGGDGSVDGGSGEGGGGGNGSGDTFGGGPGGGGVAGGETGHSNGEGTGTEGGSNGASDGTGGGFAGASGAYGSAQTGGGNGGNGGGATGGQSNGSMQAGTVNVGGQGDDSGTGAPPQGGDFAHKMPVAAEARQGGIKGTARASQDGPGGRPGEYVDHDPRAPRGQIDPSEERGQDWALKNKPGRSVPVRRTIRVVVRDDRLAILPEGAPVAGDATTGEVVPLQGDTIEALDVFVKQVRDHIESWGIAGEGLYWRPVLVLSVGPDGQRRADDLARLLKNSGLELSAAEVANNPSASARQ